MPYIASIPTLVIVLIAIKYLLGSQILYRWRPKWTRPFVLEENSTVDELPLTRGRPSLKSWALFVLAVIGIGAEIVRLVKSPFFGYVMLLVAWVGLFLVITSNLMRTDILVGSRRYCTSY